MKKISLAIIGLVVLLSGIAGATMLFTVHQTQQALVLQFGNPIRVEAEPGLKVKLPWQNVEYFDRRILDLDPPGQDVILTDQKRIVVDSFLRYRITDPLEFRIRAFTDTNFRQLFGAQLNSHVRSEVGKVALADMLSERRRLIMSQIFAQMKAQGKDFGIEVIDVRIGRTDLPEATSQAVYNRMRSERVAQAAQLRSEGAELKARIQANADRERTVIIATAKKEAEILRGEGDKTKNEILANAYSQGKELYDMYLSLDTYVTSFGAGTPIILDPSRRPDLFRHFGSQPEALGGTGRD